MNFHSRSLILSRFIIMNNTYINKFVLLAQSQKLIKCIIWTSDFYRKGYPPFFFFLVFVSIKSTFRNKGFRNRVHFSFLFYPLQSWNNEINDFLDLQIIFLKTEDSQWQNRRTNGYSISLFISIKTLKLYEDKTTRERCIKSDSIINRF